MKRILGVGIIILLLFACQEKTVTGVVGQQFILKADAPDEEGAYDYIWKIADLPDGSKLALSDIKFSVDEHQAIFVPDVAGFYAIQVTVWKYNDKLGAFAYTYDISNETPIITAEQQSREEWLNESAEEEEIIISKETVAKSVVKQKVSVPKKELPVKNVPSISIADAKYTIQVASIGKGAANSLVYRLNSAGYDAYVQQITDASNKVLYRVRIGKFATKSDALQIAKQLEGSQGLPTWVTSY